MKNLYKKIQTFWSFFFILFCSGIKINKNESEFIPWSRAWLSNVSNMSCEYDMAGLSYVLVFNTQNVQIV